MFKSVDPQTVYIIRVVSFFLFCLAGAAPSALQILRSNRR